MLAGLILVLLGLALAALATCKGIRADLDPIQARKVRGNRAAFVLFTIGVLLAACGLIVVVMCIA